MFTIGGVAVEFGHLVTACTLVGGAVSFLLMYKANRRERMAAAALVEAEARAKDFETELHREEARRATAEWEIKIRQTVPRYTDFVLNYERQRREIRTLINTTEIDRFIQFKAINGATVPQYTSAFHQIREDGQELWEFEHLPLDDHYRGMFAHLLNGEPYIVVTDNLPPCMLRDIYVAEGVTGSVVYYIASFTLDESRGAVLHVYLSLATHVPGGVSDLTVTKCSLMVNRIRAFAATFALASSVNALPGGG